MTIEQEKQTTPTPEVAPTTQTTMDIDLNGKSYKNIPIEFAKEVIAFRQETKSLKDKVTQSEAERKAQAEKLKLTEMMQAQNLEGIRAEVTKEYIEKIQKYESQIYSGEVKAILSSLNVLPDSINDATQLVMKDAQFALKDNKVMIGEKEAKEYVSEFIKTRPYLLKATIATGTGADRSVTKVVRAEKNTYESMGKGLQKLLGG